jgi:HEAT repeat protein
MVASFGDLPRSLVERIGELRANALPAFSQVLACLQDQMSEIRAHATLTLARMEANSAEVVAALVQLLEDPDAGVQENAGIALAALGPAAKAALPALRHKCQDSQEPRMAAIARVAVDSITP